MGLCTSDRPLLSKRQRFEHTQNATGLTVFGVAPSPLSGHVLPYAFEQGWVGLCQGLSPPSPLVAVPVSPEWPLSDLRRQCTQLPT
jgi:hypothetical protein